jgi:rhodanese-related sulfurtransferase
MTQHNVKRELYEQFARVGKALSSGKRLEMLEFLAQKERTVEAMSKLADQSVANTSQHLLHLRRAGLAVARKEGLYVYYSLAGKQVVALLGALTALGETHLAEVHKLIQTYLSSKDSLEAVPAKELLQRARKGLVTVLDVRPADEFESGHIAGAVNIPVGQIRKRLHELPADREIVAYCRGPYCLLAYDAVAELRKIGRKAHRLESGFPEWMAAGLPVESTEIS